jgi:hypothetical protein
VWEATYVFARRKQSGKYTYLQIVHSERIEGRVRQRVIATLGRLDDLRQSGQLEQLLTSLGRFSDCAAVLGSNNQDLQAHATCVGAPRLFQRLWEDLGLPAILNRLLKDRQFAFPVERAVFLSVLQRLLCPGSDRAASYWAKRYAIPGAEDVELHHLYRAMAWLGEALGDQPPSESPTPLAPRCTKDLLEEALFARRHDLFSRLELVFFDTTSLYFEGQGGPTLGHYGYSKDHRPDCKQMLVGAVLDRHGRPLCCELWPGNTADVETLLPVVDRLRQRFSLTRLCIVADRGMISKKTLNRLDARGVPYILGARLRLVKEVREGVLNHPGRFETVLASRQHRRGPLPLKVKDVRLAERRYVVCVNEEQARKDRADREAILEALRTHLKQGDKALIGNKGYRKYLKTEGERFRMDEAKARDEERFDGTWVLQTSLDAEAGEVALQYKQLWQVEQIFRTAKSTFETRPIYHQRDETIRGHVFCSFLALVLLHELYERLEAQGHGAVEWERLKQDLDTLQEVRLETQGKTYLVRTSPRGSVSAAFAAVGVSLGPTIRELED